MIVKYIILFVTVELAFDVGYNRKQQFFSNGDNFREILIIILMIILTI